MIRFVISKAHPDRGPVTLNPFLGGDSTIRSLNRAQIVELPGIRVDDGVLGKSGYQLLSALTLLQQILVRSNLLEIDPNAGDPVRQLDRCFAADTTRPHALDLARDYGRRLGYLLLMLVRGDPANRAARPEWSDGHWAFWKTIRRVCVGGGLVAGQFGEHTACAAQGLLDENHANLQVECSPYGAYLTMVGLARCAPPGAPRMLILDFGQTSVKRGLANYNGQGLAGLELLSMAKPPCEDVSNVEFSAMAARARWGRMLAVVEESRHLIPAVQPETTALGISLSCYLFDGHPSPREHGCYASLQLLTNHLESFMRQEIAGRLGFSPALILRHDGSAAAATYAGSPHTLVLTLGTAIGNGFPPRAEGHVPLDPSFAILS